jgi:hypothetical protein
MAQVQVNAKITANGAVVATTPLRSMTSNGGKDANPQATVRTDRIPVTFLSFLYCAGLTLWALYWAASVLKVRPPVFVSGVAVMALVSSRLEHSRAR